ncbi:MAG: hypothetical protein KAQ85_07625 [Thermodesulfovibrionia bacterium]|nr:hypothetical protein [Thermodesulfovibrionia bacterium]
MKKLFILFLALVVLVVVGCGTVGLKPMDPFSPPPLDSTGVPTCSIYEDNDIASGLIYDNVRNPCAAQNILIFIAQGGYTFEAYQFEDFKKWADSLKVVLGNGISYTSFRALILKAVMDQNRKMGMLLFSASGLIDMFQGDALMDANDVKLSVMSIDDLIEQVRLLTVFD